MARPEFTQLRASQEQPNIRTEQIDVTTGSGVQETIVSHNPQASEGVIWDIINFHVALSPPSGATSGTHRIDIEAGGITGGTVSEAGVFVTRGASNFDNDLTFTGGSWASADANQIPSTEAAQQAQMTIPFAWTEDNRFDVQYKNDTDAAQDQTLTFQVTHIERPRQVP